MVAGHQVGQGDVVHHLGHRRLDLGPHLYGDALVHALAAAIPGGAAHGRQVSLQHPQDLPHGVVLGFPGQQVAAAGPPHAADQARPAQLGDDLFQIFVRDLLPLGHVPQRDGLAGAGQRDIQHHPQGVTALGGNFHGGSP